MRNIHPKVWGRQAWIFLHCIIRAYPDKPTQSDKETYKSFFTSLKNILPCQRCRGHYSIDLAWRPLTDNVLANKENLLKWWVALRNDENTHIGKSAKTIEEYDAEAFSPVEAKSKSTKFNWLLFALAIVIVIAFVMWLIHKH